MKECVDRRARQDKEAISVPRFGPREPWEPEVSTKASNDLHSYSRTQ
jgi:hypothetical protein